MASYRETHTYRSERLSLDSPTLLEYARFELSRRRSLRFRMSGTSMRPTIDDGDVVTVEPIEATAVQPQDVIFYVSASGIPLVHRVIAFEQRSGCTYVVTRADHAQVTNIPVPLAQVLGRVTTIQRHGSGRLISLTPTPSVFSRIEKFLKRIFSGRKIYPRSPALRRK
jgi:signal peptidase I